MISTNYCRILVIHGTARNVSHHDCGLCLQSVKNTDPAIECDTCKLWIHNRCAVVTPEEYLMVQATNCAWSCPKCDADNLSSSFSSLSTDFETRNQFEVLSDNYKPTKINKPTVNKNKIIIVSMNINSIRGKKTRVTVIPSHHGSRCSCNSGNQIRQ